MLLTAAANTSWAAGLIYVVLAVIPYLVIAYVVSAHKGAQEVSEVGAGAPGEAGEGTDTR